MEHRRIPFKIVEEPKIDPGHWDKLTPEEEIRVLENFGLIHPLREASEAMLKENK